MAVLVRSTLFGRGRPQFDPGFSGVERFELGAWAAYRWGWFARDEGTFEALVHERAGRLAGRPLDPLDPALLAVLAPGSGSAGLG